MTRNGADLLIETAEGLGVTTCFANPGTTELHLVDALGRARSMETILTLFEGVASGAAEGYARMAGRPALGLFHLGPGYANSLANQHNARRHHSPMINLIGDHATWHRAHDAPLHSDIDLLARWTGERFEAADADSAGKTMIDAYRHATTGAGRTSTIVFPTDAAWASTGSTPPSYQVGDQAEAVDGSLVSSVAEALGRPGAAIIAGGARLSAASLHRLAAIAEATGCRVHISRVARVEAGRDVPSWVELPYFPEPLAAALADTKVAVMVGRSEPVTFFGYPGIDSTALPSECERITLVDPGEESEAAIAALAEELGATTPAPVEGRGPLTPPPGPLTTSSIGRVFASCIPEGAIVLAEAVTAAAGYREVCGQAAPHTTLAMLGGAIGGGLPAAVGAAVACPDRPVLALQADGSSLYTIQSLWTMAREQLDVTVVICANRAYQILATELERAGMPAEGSAKSLVALDDPPIDFTALAQGLGVASERVDNGADLVQAINRAATAPGPHLIEAVMVG